MRIKCITCEALARPTYLSAAYSPHNVDVDLVERGLHNRPAGLRQQLQAQIDAASEQKLGERYVYDAVILVYGLCGQATAGLVARRIPLVIPKAHDCITLFLGSRQRYQDQFENHPGTYWYAQDYIERDDGTGSALSMGSGADTDLELVYDEYVQKYGKDNADYLMEVIGAWQSHYQRAVYIDMGIADGAGVAARAQAEAARRGWTFERLPGDMLLLRGLLSGAWMQDPAATSSSDYLVVPPGQQVKMTFDGEVIGSAVVE